MRTHEHARSPTRACVGTQHHAAPPAAAPPPQLAFYPPTPPSYAVRPHADGTGQLYIAPLERG